MEIYLLDKELNILGVFQRFEAIIWNMKFHEPGNFKASFLFTEKMNRLLQRGNILYKTDEQEAAVITRKYLKLDNKGQETIQVQGYMLSRYLNQRIIWKKTVLKGTSEMVMRELVYANAIAPEDSARIIPQLELGTIKGYKDEIEKQVTYSNLQEELTAISKTAELGYRFLLDLENRKIYFDIYKGNDRTIGSEFPCVFTRDYGNVYTQNYSEDSSNYRNVCLVGGAGEDEERVLKTVGEYSGLERYEMFYNASGLSNTDISTEEYLAQLEQKGIEKLSDYKVATSFESKINQNRIKEILLGDYVTCTDKKWGITMNTQIKAIEKGFSKKERSLVITFGDEQPTLISLLKAGKG